jgi:hypothetical protein
MPTAQTLAVLASPTVEELATRLVEAGQAIGLFVGILVVVYLPGRLLVGIRSTFIRRTTERFAEDGIEMPYPTRELRGSVESRAPPETDRSTAGE